MYLHIFLKKTIIIKDRQAYHLDLHFDSVCLLPCNTIWKQYLDDNYVDDSTFSEFIDPLQYGFTFEDDMQLLIFCKKKFVCDLYLTNMIFYCVRNELSTFVSTRGHSYLMFLKGIPWRVSPFSWLELSLFAFRWGVASSSLWEPLLSSMCWFGSVSFGWYPTFTTLLTFAAALLFG